MGTPIYLVEITANLWPVVLRAKYCGVNNSRQYVSRTRIPYDASKTYRITAIVRKNSIDNGKLYAGVRCYDASGAELTPAGVPFAWYAAYYDTTVTTSWGTRSATFGAAGTYSVPAGTVTMAPAIALPYDATAGYMEARELWIEDTSSPGVEISSDRYFRNSAEWINNSGPAADFVVLPENTSVQTITLRYSTGAYVTAAADTPANTQYAPRVVHPGFVRAELPRECYGQIKSTFGQIVLANADGALNNLAWAGLGGQTATVLYGDSDAARSTFVTVLVSTVQQAVVDRAQVQIRLSGIDNVLQRPLLVNTYAGSNSLPNGLEGVATDLKGRPKPKLYGRVFNLAPPCVNTSRYIYQVHDPNGPNAYNGSQPDTLAVSAVRVRGLPLSAGANYTNQADMETNAPAANQYRVWPAGGMFRLGTAPAGLVTCDAERQAGGYLAQGSGWAQLIGDIAFDAGLAIGAEIHWGDSSAKYVSQLPYNLDAGVIPDYGPACGVWVDDSRTTQEVLADLSSAGGFWFGFINWGGLPGGAPQFGGDVYGQTATGNWPTLDESVILGVAALADPGLGRGVPVWRVELTYKRNAAPQTVDFDASVTQADRALLSAPNQRVVSQDANIKLLHPTATVLVRDTCQSEAAQAQAEADRLLYLYRFARPWYEVRISAAAVRAMTYKPRLGGWVTLTWPTLGVLSYTGAVGDPDVVPPIGGVFKPAASGRFVIHAIELDMLSNEMRLTVRQDVEEWRTA